MSAMQGFDAEFADLDGYIRSITARIWEGRRTGDIHRYYTADCAVITPGGTSVGADAVVQGTLDTLAQFPDRRLLCEDIVTAGDDHSGYLSSHRIASTMTHLGDGAFGAASGARIHVRTVADCVCRDNRIAHEWLVRDQGAIARQIGIEPQVLAARWLAERGAPTHPQPLPLARPAAPSWWRDPMHTTAGAQLLAATYRALWAGELAVLERHADEAIDVRLPGGAAALGIDETTAFWSGLTQAFAGAAFAVESLAERIEPGRTPRVAMRWRVAGRHVGDGPFGAPTQRPVEILGITHAEVATVAGELRILREWVLIDEVALWMQLLPAA